MDWQLRQMAQDNINTYYRLIQDLRNFCLQHREYYGLDSLFDREDTLELMSTVVDEHKNYELEKSFQAINHSEPNKARDLIEYLEQDLAYAKIRLESLKRKEDIEKELNFDTSDPFSLIIRNRYLEKHQYELDKINNQSCVALKRKRQMEAQDQHPGSSVSE